MTQQDDMQYGDEECGDDDPQHDAHDKRMKKELAELDSKRMASVRNTRVLLEKAGAGIEPSWMTVFKFNFFVNEFYGMIELDSETGEFVQGTVERLEFETKFQLAIEEHVRASHERIMELRAQMEAQSQLYVPGAPNVGDIAKLLNPDGFDPTALNPSG